MKSPWCSKPSFHDHAVESREIPLRLPKYQRHSAIQSDVRHMNTMILSLADHIMNYPLAPDNYRNTMEYCRCPEFDGNRTFQMDGPLPSGSGCRPRATGSSAARRDCSRVSSLLVSSTSPGAGATARPSRRSRPRQQLCFHGNGRVHRCHLRRPTDCIQGFTLIADTNRFRSPRSTVWPGRDGVH